MRVSLGFDGSGPDGPRNTSFACAVALLPLLLSLFAATAYAQPGAGFVFQNNFWVNLHQHLFAEAGRSGEAGRAGGAGRLEPGWRSALEAYARVANRSLLFDAGLVAANDTLARVSAGDAGDDVTLPATIEPAIRDALVLAAPIYRAQLWPRHRHANDAWIAAITPRVERHGAALTRALAHAYHAEWPAQPILVDVSVDAGVFGGYTTNGAPAGFAAHSTIASSGAGSEGDMGVETVFHEASHAVDAQIMRAIGAECAAQQVRTPPNLWHALVFYTTGELVRQELGKVGDAHYMPYAYRFDVYSKGMEQDRAALEHHWQPWLDGKVPFEEALRNVVRAATAR